MGKLATSLVPLSQGYGVEPSTPVLITLQGVLFPPVLYGVVTMMNYCIAGVLSACGAYIIPVLTVISG